MRAALAQACDVPAAELSSGLASQTSGTLRAAPSTKQRLKHVGRGCFLTASVDPQQHDLRAVRNPRVTFGSQKLFCRPLLPWEPSPRAPTDTRVRGAPALYLKGLRAVHTVGPPHLQCKPRVRKG